MRDQGVVLLDLYDQIIEDFRNGFFQGNELSEAVVRLKRSAMQYSTQLDRSGDWRVRSDFSRELAKKDVLLGDLWKERYGD